MNALRKQRDLSAIGYVFARRILKASNVPVGVIDASRGGTTVETWTPLPVLRAMEGAATKARLAASDQAVDDWDAEADLQQRITQHNQWIENQTRQGNTIPEDRNRPAISGRVR